MMYQRLLDGPAFAAATDRPGAGPRPSVRSWDAAPDLERFLVSFYQYFELRGYWGVVASHLSHVAALAFTIGFSFVLFFFVNWPGILSCSSEESCRAVPLLFEHPFRHVGPWRFLVFLSSLLFVVYWIFNVTAAYSSIVEAGKMSTYYKERLGITSDSILSTMLWSEVVSRLIQQQRVSPWCIVQDELTALEIANIIMREDNFVVALTNHSTFTSHLPPWIPPRLVYTRALRWNLRTAVFRWLFDQRGRIRADFLDRPLALAQRLQWLGMLNLALMAPVLLFVTIFFFMRHAEEFRSHRTSPFERQWTGYAHWTFREFNELPHQFKARMCQAQGAAESYLRSTREPSPVLDSARRFAKFVAGSILAVLLVVALYDDSPLLFVKIQDKNLLWYLALFGFLFAVADTSQDASGQACPQEQQPSSPAAPLRMHTAMMKLVRCTHFLPPSWRSPAPLEELAGACGAVRRANLCGHFRRVRSDFLRDFFVHRIQALGEEVLGVMLCPLLLMVYLPKAAPEIADVLRRSQHSSKNLGDWCVLGCLDPSRNGSEWYSGTQRAAAGGSDGGSSSAREPPAMLGWTSRDIGSHGGKLEKSVVSFVLAHRLPWLLREGDEEPLPGAAPPGRLEHFSGVLALGRSIRLNRQEAERSWVARRDGEEIAMRDLAVDAAASASEEPPRSAVAAEEGRAAAEAADPTELWGCPPSALRLVQELEDFQEHEMGVTAQRASEERKAGGACAVGGARALLPEELVGKQPLRHTSSRAECSTPQDEEQASCGPLFFWLEALRDARAAGGRRASARAAQPCPDVHEAGRASHAAAYSDEVTFELLERDASP